MHKNKLKIGDIIKDEKRDLIIIDLELRDYKRKRYGKDCIEKRYFYKYKCNNCGNEHWIWENKILNEKQGCNVCGIHPNKVTEFNCIATKRPDLMKYIKNKEDGFKYTPYSKAKIECICPNCETEKIITIGNLSTQGFSCDKCNDGISRPEKIMISILNQLGIKFICQLSKKDFEWCNKYRYDFYLPNYNVIIETHGSQHYIESFEYLGGRTLQEEQENDKHKKELALRNKIDDYIIIDCQKTNIDYIRTNIEKSNLSNIFDLSKINWKEVDKFATSNLVKKVCNIKNKNPKMSTLEISKILGISRKTVIDYLKQGNELNWCKYDSQKEMMEINYINAKNNQRKVEIFKDGKSLGVFESIKILSDKSEELFGVKLNRSSIGKVCRGKQEFHKGYNFKYVDYRVEI